MVRDLFDRFPRVVQDCIFFALLTAAAFVAVLWSVQAAGAQETINPFAKEKTFGQIVVDFPGDAVVHLNGWPVKGKDFYSYERHVEIKVKHGGKTHSKKIDVVHGQTIVVTLGKEGGVIVAPFRSRTVTRTRTVIR
jgi:hypothetical protein